MTIRDFPDPYLTPWDLWAATIIKDSADYIIPPHEGDWLYFAQALIRSGALDGYEFSDPTFYTDWRDWAISLMETSDP